MILPVLEAFSETLTKGACSVLGTSDPVEKCHLTRCIFNAWQTGSVASIGEVHPPDHPARPEAPLMLPPAQMPRRSTGSHQGRLHLIHALAHIELNAVDLAWDIIARFVAEDMPKAFYDDWIRVAYDEAQHFEELAALLQRRGTFYGAFPAHGGLWQAAEKTAGSLEARLSIVPLVLEARGLDTTPAMIERLHDQNDDEFVDVLRMILNDEITHVAAGVRWLNFLAHRKGSAGQDIFQENVRRYHTGALKPPFNVAARDQAGFPESWYNASSFTLT